MTNTSIYNMQQQAILHKASKVVKQNEAIPRAAKETSACNTASYTLTYPLHMHN